MSKSISRVPARVGGCGCEHCQRLLEYLYDDIDIADLQYEDVFTPLKHHAIALYVADAGYVIRSDMCFRVSDTNRTWTSAIDPFSVWNVLDLHDERGMVRFEVIQK
jgi:hypothetical protein